jgi:hypothetical protein
LGAKKEAQALSKILDGYTGPLTDLFKKGMDISKISNANQKVIANAVRASGEEITSADEKRSFETQKELVEIAFQVKKGAILEQKETAKGIKGFGLSVQKGWLEAKNSWDKGLTNLQEKIADHADIKNLGGAISQDFSLLTTEFQGIMAVPGMKTISAGVKFIAAWLASLATTILKKWLLGDKEKKTTGVLGKAAAGIKEGASKAKSFVMGGEARDKGKFTSKFSQENIFGKMKIGFEKMGDQISDGFQKGVESGKEFVGKVGKFWDTHKEAFTVESMGEKIGEFRDKMKGWITSTVDFVKAVPGKIVKMVKMFKTSVITWFWSMIDFIKAMPGAIVKMVKAFRLMMLSFITVMWNFLVQIGLFIINMIIAIAGFIIANLPLIALIALVVLIVIGWFLLIKYMMDNWEWIKVKFAMAIDRLKLWGEKTKNWFSDLGGDIAYRIQWLIAKIKDGIAGMANAVIKKLNKWFGMDIEEFETGNMAQVTSDRDADLASRDERDKKLQADFDAKYKERGKELEEAAKKDADRKADKDAAGSTDIKTSTVVTTDNREVTMVAESTSSGDQWATLATQQRG